MSAHEKDIQRSRVYNGNTLVGYLNRLPDKDHTTLFSYAPEYEGPEIPGIPRSDDPVVSKGVHPFFCNKVSEGWLEQAQRSVLSGGNITRFSILNYFDNLGSWWVEPEGEMPVESVKLLREVASKIAFTSGASIPGQQPKFLVRKIGKEKFTIATREKNRAACRGTHIAKLLFVPPDVVGRLERAAYFPNVVKNEFVTTEIVRALLPEDRTAHVELGTYPKVDGNVLFVERFDIDPQGNYIDFYECAQLFGKTTDQKFEGSYKQIADYIRDHATENPPDGIRTDIRDIDIFFKRLLAMILVENRDTHLKNIGFLREGDVFRLAPNYDVVSYSTYRVNSIMALEIKGGRPPQLKSSHILFLASDLGLLSEKPTPEEFHHVTSLVKEMSERAQTLTTDLENLDLSAYPTLSLAHNRFRLTEELKNAASCLKKKNGLLEGVPTYIRKKGLLTQNFDETGHDVAQRKQPARTNRPSPQNVPVAAI